MLSQIKNQNKFVDFDKGDSNRSGLDLDYAETGGSLCFISTPAPNGLSIYLILVNYHYFLFNVNICVLDYKSRGLYENENIKQAFPNTDIN